MPVFLAPACALAPIKAYEGPAAPASTLAMLHVGRMGDLQINGKAYTTRTSRTLHLLPGKYWIFWACHEERFGWEASAVVLQAGHQYSAKCTAREWHVSDIGNASLAQQQILTDETEDRVLAAKYPISE